MREFSIEEKLQRTLDKLQKKNKTTYEILMKKIEEILTSQDIHHYKNLRRPLQHLKRVHVNGPFVLVFRYLEAEDKVLFYDFDYHNSIYGN